MAHSGFHRQRSIFGAYWASDGCASTGYGDCTGSACTDAPCGFRGSRRMPQPCHDRRGGHDPHLPLRPPSPPSKGAPSAPFALRGPLPRALPGRLLGRGSDGGRAAATGRIPRAEPYVHASRGARELSAAEPGSGQPAGKRAWRSELRRIEDPCSRPRSACCNCQSAAAGARNAVAEQTRRRPHRGAYPAWQ